MSWNIVFFRNLVLKLQNSLIFFHTILGEKSQSISLTILKSRKLPKLQDLDTKSQFFNLSEFCIMEDVNFF